MIKKFILILVVILVLIGLVYYSSKIQKPKNKSAQKITVLLDWFPNTNHTGIYVAKDQNYFDNAGLDVEIIQPAEGDNLQVLASGKADFAVSSQEAVTLARAEDLPVVSIAAIIQHNTSAFASLEKSNIKTVKDFEGKRYGGWGSPIEEAVLKAVMQDAKADYSKVKNVTIGTTDFFTSISKDSDFQWIFYGWDGIEAKRRGIKLNTIMLKNLNPVLDYYTPVLVASEKNIKENKDTVKKFITAVQKGYDFAIQNPNESANILIKMAPELNADLVKESQKYLSTEYKSDAPKWGHQKEEVWNNYISWLNDRKLLKKNIYGKLAFTNEFLE